MDVVLLTFAPGRPRKSLGPFKSIRLNADGMHDGANGALVAHHRDHHWVIGQDKYYRLETGAKVNIHFERVANRENPPEKSRVCGPYQRFHTVDGVAYADDRVFAVIESAAPDWFCYHLSQRWPLMVVTEAEPSATNRIASLAPLAPLVSGIISLWQGAQLFYLGRAASIRLALEELSRNFDAAAVTSVAWEPHPHPAAREAELLRRYEAGAPRSKPAAA